MASNIMNADAASGFAILNTGVSVFCSALTEGNYEGLRDRGSCIDAANALDPTKALGYTFDVTSTTPYVDINGNSDCSGCYAAGGVFRFCDYDASVGVDGSKAAGTYTICRLSVSPSPPPPSPPPVSVRERNVPGLVASM